MPLPYPFEPSIKQSKSRMLSNRPLPLIPTTKITDQDDDPDTKVSPGTTSTPLHPETSFLDLPFEIRLQIYEMTFPEILSLQTGLVGHRSQSSRSSRLFIDPINDNPPFFSSVLSTDRRTAINLLLTHTRIHHEVTNWLYTHRRFEFLDLAAVPRLELQIGPVKLGLIKRVEICGGWGNSHNPAGCIKGLVKVVRSLTNIESFGLLWFTKGPRELRPCHCYGHFYHGIKAADDDNKRRWTGSQLEIMRRVLDAHVNLTTIYRWDKYRQIRFCSDNMKMMSCEEEIDVQKEIKALERRFLYTSS